jgi:hypothetical protein
VCFLATFPAKSVANSSGFSKKIPKVYKYYLIIAELGFDDFWVFSIDCVSAMHGILELMILLRNDL